MYYEKDCRIFTILCKKRNSFLSCIFHVLLKYPDNVASVKEKEATLNTVNSCPTSGVRSLCSVL